MGSDPKMIILQIDGENSHEDLRKKFDGIWNDPTKVLLIILRDGAANIEQNACDAVGNNPGVRQAVWIKSTEILSNDELNKFTNMNPANVVCSASLSRAVEYWMDAAKAANCSEIETCFNIAENDG